MATVWNNFFCFLNDIINFMSSQMSNTAVHISPPGSLKKESWCIFDKGMDAFYFSDFNDFYIITGLLWKQIFQSNATLM